jgi:hypothetical protein
MLKVVGRQVEDYIRLEEIDNFPCTDLQTIDKLWFKYSYGRFGFYIQTKIYQSLGGTSKYNEKVWQAFNYVVGWTGVNHITVNINAPQGYFPRILGKKSKIAKLYGWTDGWVHLFSRFQTLDDNRKPDETIQKISNIDVSKL